MEKTSNDDRNGEILSELDELHSSILSLCAEGPNTTTQVDNAGKENVSGVGDKNVRDPPSLPHLSIPLSPIKTEHQTLKFSFDHININEAMSSNFQLMSPKISSNVLSKKDSNIGKLKLGISKSCPIQSTPKLSKFMRPVLMSTPVLTPCKEDVKAEESSDDIPYDDLLSEVSSLCSVSRITDKAETFQSHDASLTGMSSVNAEHQVSKIDLQSIISSSFIERGGNLDSDSSVTGTVEKGPGRFAGLSASTLRSMTVEEEEDDSCEMSEDILGLDDYIGSQYDSDEDIDEETLLCSENDETTTENNENIMKKNNNHTVIEICNDTVIEVSDETTIKVTDETTLEKCDAAIVSREGKDQDKNDEIGKGKSKENAQVIPDETTIERNEERVKANNKAVIIEINAEIDIENKEVCIKEKNEIADSEENEETLKENDQEKVSGNRGIMIERRGAVLMEGDVKENREETEESIRKVLKQTRAEKDENLNIHDEKIVTGTEENYLCLGKETISVRKNVKNESSSRSEAIVIVTDDKKSVMRTEKDGVSRGTCKTSKPGIEQKIDKDSNLGISTKQKKTTIHITDSEIKNSNEMETIKPCGSCKGKSSDLEMCDEFELDLNENYDEVDLFLEKEGYTVIDDTRVQKKVTSSDSMATNKAPEKENGNGKDAAVKSPIQVRTPHTNKPVVNVFNLKQDSEKPIVTSKSPRQLVSVKPVLMSDTSKRAKITKSTPSKDKSPCKLSKAKNIDQENKNVVVREVKPKSVESNRKSSHGNNLNEMNEAKKKSPLKEKDMQSNNNISPIDRGTEINRKYPVSQRLPDSNVNCQNGNEVLASEVASVGGKEDSPCQSMLKTLEKAESDERIEDRKTRRKHSNEDKPPTMPVAPVRKSDTDPKSRERNSASPANMDNHTRHSSVKRGKRFVDYSAHREYVKNENELMRKVMKKWGSHGIQNPDTNLTFATRYRTQNGSAARGRLEGPKLCTLWQNDEMERQYSSPQRKRRRTEQRSVVDNIANLKAQLNSINQENRNEIQKIHRLGRHERETLERQHRNRTRNLRLQQNMEISRLRHQRIYNPEYMQYQMLQLRIEHQNQGAHIQCVMNTELKNHDEHYKNKISAEDQKFNRKREQLMSLIEQLESEEYTDKDDQLGPHVTTQFVKGPCRDNNNRKSFVSVCLPTDIATSIMREDEIYDNYYTH